VLQAIPHDVHTLAVGWLVSGEGWLVGEYGQSCTDACTENNLACSNANQALHNNEVDTNAELDAVLRRLNETESYWVVADPHACDSPPSAGSL
jgi:hypothetical protein